MESFRRNRLDLRVFVSLTVIDSLPRISPTFNLSMSEIRSAEFIPNVKRSKSRGLPANDFSSW